MIGKIVKVIVDRPLDISKALWLLMVRNRMHIFWA